MGSVQNWDHNSVGAPPEKQETYRVTVDPSPTPVTIIAERKRASIDMPPIPLDIITS